MTLGEFATALGASPRWVLNALTRLKVARRYSEPLARRLALARMLAEDLGVALPEAFTLAGRALAETDPFGTWRQESPNGAIVLLLEMPRFFSSYLPRLSLARSSYGEKRRGRRPTRKKSATQRAQEYGVDTTLFGAQLTRSPQQRVRELDQNIAFLRGVKVKP